MSSNEDMRQLSGILYGIILSALDEIISDKRIREITSLITDKNRSKSLELHASLYALSSLQEYKFYSDKNFPPFIGEDIFTSLGELIMILLYNNLNFLYIILYYVNNIHFFSDIA